MMRNSEDAIRVGQAIQTALQEIRLLAMRELFNNLTKIFLEKEDFDRAMYFACQAQFCREALEVIVRGENHCDACPLT